MSAIPPELQRFIAAAREQPILATNVTADAVLAGLEQHRRRAQARRTLTFSAAIALAASLIVLGLLWPMLSARDAQPEPTGHAVVLDSDHDAGHESGHEAGHEFGHELRPDHLANAVSVRTSTMVEVRGPWLIALDEGIHELEVEATPGRVLRVSLPDREFELVEGFATVEIVHGTAAVRLHNGVAAWVGEDGQHSAMTVEQITLTADPATAPELVGSAAPTATQLAREAELLLAAGKSDKAENVLRRLLAEYPKASQTRSGLLDLARLLRNSRRHDEARCAYQVYLQRWPNSAVDTEVRSQLERLDSGLGSGRGCRGLDPR